MVDEVKGTVKVKLPGHQPTFVDLDADRGIPVGSTVDTKKGTVELTSIPRAGRPPETARSTTASSGSASRSGITTLTLTEALAPAPSGRARAAAKKPKTRKLWGDGKGAFRTSGKYSAATVRGTKWLVQDSCAGTLTRVTQGVGDRARQRHARHDHRARRQALHGAAASADRSWTTFACRPPVRRLGSLPGGGKGE